MTLLDTALLPHGIGWFSDKIQMASIDHAMWFHRPVRVDEWLLYDIDSPSASGARGFARGSVYARDGRLVGSTAQEGLLRVVGKEARAD
jgi:acyl-CoA thioesterase-2